MTRHVVKRLPVDTGTSGWEAISTRSAPVRVLEGDVVADWLIVGAGFAGLSAARRLSQLRPGKRIVVLNAREIATGPAGRNSGYMIDVPHSLSSGEYSVGSEKSTALEIAQNRFANSFTAEAAAEHGMSACCKNGLGTVKSTLAGALAADLATGTRSEHLKEFQNQPAPSRLPPEPIA